MGKLEQNSEDSKQIDILFNNSKDYLSEINLSVQKTIDRFNTITKTFESNEDSNKILLPTKHLINKIDAKSFNPNLLKVSNKDLIETLSHFYFADLNFENDLFNEEKVSELFQNKKDIDFLVNIVSFIAKRLATKKNTIFKH